MMVLSYQIVFTFVDIKYRLTVIIHVFEETAQEIPPLIACDSNLFAINSKFVALVDQNRLDMFNYQGASKGSIMMTPGEGDITHLHSAGSFIAMVYSDTVLFSTETFIKIYVHISIAYKKYEP